LGLREQTFGVYDDLCSFQRAKLRTLIYTTGLRN
jgi:hypothetical protein